MKSFLKQLVPETFFLFAGLFLILSSCIVFFCGIERLEVVHYALVCQKLPGAVFFLAAGMAALLAVILLGKYFPEKISGFSSAMHPAFLLIFLFPFRTCFFSLLLFLLTVLLSIYRVVQHIRLPVPETETISLKRAWLFIFFITAAGILYGWDLQIEAFERLWFRYGDWCQYFEGYRTVMKGGADCWRAILVNSGHVNLLPNLLLAPLLALAPVPETLFLIHSIGICSIIPAWFFLAETLKIRRLWSLMAAAAMLLHFTLPNLNLSFFYGYHPIVFFPAMLLCFFAFREKKSRTGMTAIFILTLLLKETTAIFWAGYALFLLSGKKYRTGIVLFLFSFLWFVLMAKVVMPLGLSSPVIDTEYVQTFHYGKFGSSIHGVILAPILQPLVWGKHFFSLVNLQFVFMMLLPFLPFVIRKYRMLLMILPLLYVFFMKSPMSVNVSVWYQTEIFACLCGCALLDFRDSPSQARIVFLIAGFLLCGFFFGRLPYGKYSASAVREYPLRGKDILALYEKIPPGASIQTTPRFYIRFMERNPMGLLGIKSKEFTADYVIAEIDDPLWDRNGCIELVKRIAASGKYDLLINDDTTGSSLFLFRKKDIAQ